MKPVSGNETTPPTTRTVERACAVLSAFCAAQPRLSLQELAANVALPKATVHRLAGALVATGFLQRGADGRYSLGSKVSELGAAARAGMDVVEVCAPTLDALATATRETVLLAAVDWDALELTIVAARASPLTLSVVPATGERVTIPPGCLGKALLAGLSAPELDTVLARIPLPTLTNKTHTDRFQLLGELRRARAAGYAVAEEEYLEGVSGVAVPVMFSDNRPRAAIGVVGPSARLAGRMEQIGELALELTSNLNARPTASQVAV